MLSNELTISINEMIQLIEFERREAERKRNTLIARAKAFNQTVTVIEIEQVGHENDKKADAYYMVMNTIVSKSMGNSSGKELAKQLSIVYPDNTPVEKPKAEAKVVPTIVNPNLKEKVENILGEVEIEDSIYEAVRLSEGKKGSSHWETARSKVMHFYRGSDLLSTSPTNAELDNVIIAISDKVRTRVQRKFEEEIGLDRNVLPYDTPDKIQKIQYLKQGKFNIAVLTGDGKDNTEDRVKITAINEFIKGNEKLALRTLMVFYENKGWDESVAREFLHALMKKDPLKELNIVVKGILEFNRTTNGDPKKGIKLCRNIIGAYFDKKYTVQVGEKVLTSEEVKNNKIIDRIINKHLNPSK